MTKIISIKLFPLSPAVVAWFAKASVFHSVKLYIANGGSNPIKNGVFIVHIMKVIVAYSYECRTPGNVTGVYKWKLPQEAQMANCKHVQSELKYRP